ncbi:ATP-dependent helicase/deoxyribonuclease subunit B [Clostridium aceticum]|uniref:ATP-dependent helicase/deoxyribonuclease subunit B n=1 Tax=Clostridium aceticum TaxID=84022 RepID=A0A0D8IEB9_9CLOT|nr:helicase-exonuclease AddAB subunit AddB [Clostridium aceticum]AKL96785.1 ATP-dependent helicase/deoxyribonuclease subunit B [Clostridium aceticum]KJF27541.1 ATP-dependent helicase [Clostridium aceticum]
MGITYITGRAGTGKSFYVLTQIKERLQQQVKHPLILITPEQFTLQAERDLIEKQQLDGILQAEVLSFTRLAHRVFNEVGGLTKVPVNTVGKSMIIKKILDEKGSLLTVYKNTSKQEGFIGKLNDMICELKQYDISPLDLNRATDEIQEDSILKMKLSDIALIYHEFSRYLENRYVDNEDHLNLFMENIEKAGFLEEAEIWIDGFHVFTPQTLKIIEKLLLKAREVHITFTLELRGKEREKDLFQVPENTHLKIKKIAHQLNIEEKVVNLDLHKRQEMGKTKEIAHIEEEFFSYPYRQFTKKVENIKVFAGLNPYTEVEHIAAEIIALVRERGYRFKDIAVVSGDFEGYSGIIKRVFEEYDIPYFIDEKRSIMNNPIIEFILAALETTLKNYQYREMFRLMKTGFTDLTKEEQEILENYVLRYGIRGDQWLQPFNKGEDEEKLLWLNEMREKLIEPLNKFHKKLKKDKTSQEITKAFFTFLQEMKIEEKLEKWIKVLKEKERFDYVNENTQIWNTVMEIFDQIYEILDESKISVKKYYRILESGFSACEIGVIPSTIDQVLVGNIDRSRSHDIKALFVAAVNDGILPSLQEEEGIFLDHERKALEAAGMELSASGETKLFQQNFSIYSAFTKPQEYLWISFAVGDEEGRAKRPSILIDRFKKVFPQLVVEGDIINTLENQLHLVAAPTSTFKYLAENLRLHVEDKPMEDLWWDIYHWYDHQPYWQGKKDMMIEGLFHENQVRYIDKGRVRGLYDSSPIKTSVSRLETFVKCPFAHFINYGLKPKERKEYALRTPDVGKLFHDSMEKFAKLTKEKKINWLDMGQVESDAMMEEIMQQLAKDFEHGVMLSTHRYKYLINRLTRISKKALWTLVQHIKKGDFIPYDHEVIFGEGYTIPGIIIELDDGEKIILEGRIDRVDILEDEEGNYFKVIDYKSGNKEFNLSDVYYGIQLQLMVYLEAVMALKNQWRKGKNYPAGVFYFKIDDPMVKTTDKAVEKIEKEINKAFKMKGLVLKDLKVIKGMDNEIEKYSDVIPVSLNQDETVGKKSAVATEEDFRNLMIHVKNIMKEIGKEILKGNIEIQPCKNGKQVSCQYCDYGGICQFDTVFRDNHYKNIKALTSEEVLEKLRQGKEEMQNETMDEGTESSD